MTNEEIRALIERGEAPPGLRAGTLDFTGSAAPLKLPAGLHCHTLKLAGRVILELPADLRVDFKLDAAGCTKLESLPAGFSVPVLVLRGCTALQALPEGLQADYLDIQDCTALAGWPESAVVRIGSVNARNCRHLRSLPTTLGPLSALDLAGCERIERIPPGIIVRSRLDVAGTKITSVPESLAQVPLRWRGVAVTPQIAFFPETLTVSQILAEPNAELRRVMIERIGFDRFLREAGAKVIHQDTDPGGPRELLRVKLQGDEDLVCVSVRCPSTGRHYLIRVPPNMKTCHQAVAWTAGFDDPDDYQPVAET